MTIKRLTFKFGDKVTWKGKRGIVVDLKPAEKEAYSIVVAFPRRFKREHVYDSRTQSILDSFDSMFDYILKSELKRGWRSR